MKKLLIITIILMGFMLTSCNKNNKELKIELDSNPTTGYDWEYTLSNDIVEITKEYESKCKEKNISGCGGQDIFIVKGLKEGETTIKFIYRRSWEELTGEEKIEEVNIIVDKDLNVTKK